MGDKSDNISKDFYLSTMPSDQTYRNMTICPACRKPKDPGLLCCWSCFKYRNNPFKSYKADFESWLNEVKGGEI